MPYSELQKRVLPLLFLVMFAAAAVLAFLLRHRSERIRAIPTAIVAILLLFIEVVKQRWNLIGTFDLFNLPFHYCSLFLVVIPLAELCGARLSRIFRPIATCMAFMVSVALYVCPSAIIGDIGLFGKGFKDTHGILFHYLVLLYFLLVVTMRLCKPRPRDAFLMGGLGVIYSAVVLPLSYVLETNYCNFLWSVIPALESLRLSHGQVWFTALTFLAVTVGTTISAFVFIGLYMLVDQFLKLCFPRKQRK